MDRKPIMSYFWKPLLALVIGVAAADAFAGPQMAFTVFVLAVLGISLSFDNAVVNAKILKNWSQPWRNAFLFFGILFATFGMRFAFPILIVSAFAHIPVLDTLGLALNHHAAYAAKLAGVHTAVTAFGGAFLAMLGLGYFFDAEKDSHWLAPIEGLLAKAGAFEAITTALTLAGLGAVAVFIPASERFVYLLSGAIGICAFVASRALGTFASGGAGKVVAASIFGFLYLEFLDASFSFDDVLGSFALTNDIVWIAVGLGIGALAVRELTLMAVDRDTLAEFPFLEHGAFWAILFLAFTMLTAPVLVLPEAVKGLGGVALIGAAFLTSLVANRRALGEIAEPVAA